MLCIIVGKLGSPPPMRGKVSFGGSGGACSRDHPRLCGEKLQQYNNCIKILGSPPPMRGKVAECLYYRRVSGITPAYAGKSYGVQCNR